MFVKSLIWSKPLKHNVLIQAWQNTLSYPFPSGKVLGSTQTAKAKCVLKSNSKVSVFSFLKRTWNYCFFYQLNSGSTDKLNEQKDSQCCFSVDHSFPCTSLDN